MTPSGPPTGIDLTTQRVRLVAALLGTGGIVQGAALKLRLGDGAWLIPHALTALLIAMIIAYAARYRDAFVVRLLVLGVLVGFGELVADAWAVSGVHILVYNPNGPFIWDSPAYMPFGWAVDVVELGAIGYWANAKWNLGVATLITMAVGAITLPMSETIAHYAGFWHYQNCKLFGGVTPKFIVITESMIAASFPLVALWLARVRWRGLVALAVAESALMYAISPLVFGLVERL